MDKVLQDILIDSQIEVRPVKRKGGWVDQNHDSNFLNDGASIRYCVPVDRLTGSLVDPIADFSKEQKEAFAKELGIPVEHLNVRQPKESNFWKKQEVIVDRAGYTFNLKHIESFVRYRVLLSNKELIADSWEKAYDGVYKFALVKKDEFIEQAAMKEKDKVKAYKLLGRLEASDQKMKDFLFVYGLTDKAHRSVPKDAKHDFLLAEVGRIVESNMPRFLSILEDPAYETKLLIRKAVLLGALNYTAYKYSIPGQEGAIGNLEEMVKYLDDKKNSQDRIKIIAMVDEKQHEL